jgi:uncharacterized membrane protein YcaP (DUF421 family)
VENRALTVDAYSLASPDWGTGGGAIVLATTVAQRLFSTEIPITEKIVRTVVVYTALLLDRQLRRLGIRVADLVVALRRQGAEDVIQVKQADMYPSGAIVVALRSEARGASQEDIGRIERKLDQLTATVDRLASAGA